MKLAILGTDPDLLRLATAATAEGHLIAWVGDIRPEDSEAIARLVPTLADQSSEWELVVDRGTADAVLIGLGTASTDLRAEQLKRIVAEAMPLLVVHPACGSVLPYYEVDMTRREMGGIVRHYNPVAGHPVFTELATWVRNGHPAIGPIHQVTCERRVADTTRAAVTLELACDVEALATVAGDIRRVSAIGPKMNQTSFASLQVQMTCSGPASVRWSIGSQAGADYDMAMSLVGERGTIRLLALEAKGSSEPRAWQLEIASADEHDRQSLEPYDAAHAAIQQLEQAVTSTSGEQRGEMSTWNSATRAMEVVDAVELSLEKGRTIEVYQQQLTERLAFRGTMAAMGCGLLLVGFFALVLVTMLGGVERQGRAPLVPGWEWILLAVLAVFLLLQAVPLLVRKSKPSAPQATRPDGRET
jgi:predicted dehydrogenase